MKTAQVLDLGLGNVRNVARYLEDSSFRVELSNETNVTEKVDLCVVAGVGSFDLAAQRIAEFHADKAIMSRHHQGKFTLGICLGMQLLSKESSEGTLPGLGIFPLSFRGLIKPKASWEKISASSIPEVRRAAFYYFNHGYGARLERSAEDYHAQVAETSDKLVAAYKVSNTMGIQFHAEKSQLAGRRFLREWIGGLF